MPLGSGFVFLGPNNGGKTSALQALTLWHTGLKKWEERHMQKGKRGIPCKRPGVPVTRLDLTSLPVSETSLLWHGRNVRRGSNQNIRIELIVKGIRWGKEWECGMEFDYANRESLFCRPLRLKNNIRSGRMAIPEESLDTRVVFLPPMSGLVAEEPLIQKGRINVLLGQGQTAEVLRNLCYRVYEKNKEDWNSMVRQIQEVFSIRLNEPEFLPDRGALSMSYLDADKKTTLDITSCGRGMQQTLLLLAYIYDNPKGTVFLLDEPDAHLEIFRQRQIYDRINEVAELRKSQVIAASHSEVLLNQAAQRKAAVAFLIGGRPHRIGLDKSAEVLKALNSIGFEYYYGAEQKGWILYLEGETIWGFCALSLKNCDIPQKKPSKI